MNRTVLAEMYSPNLGEYVTICVDPVVYADENENGLMSLVDEAGNVVNVEPRTIRFYDEEPYEEIDAPEIEVEFAGEYTNV